MELIITEKETFDAPTICLNMIVKNESHIIKKTLENLCSKINFSYWVICDTGSTDNTCEIISNFFTQQNIPGELYKDPWVNFAHNRTLALQRGFGKTDLLLVFDADDEIVGQPELPGVNATIYDEYHLKFGSPLGTSYTRVLLINNNKRFIYQSVIHEYIVCVEQADMPRTSATIEGDYYLVSGRGGSRSMDPEKYLKDAKILEAAYAEAVLKNDTLFKRYAFYCANSYKDYGSLEEAIKWYKITLGQENWAQELYMSCFHIHECYQKLNQTEMSFFYLVKAFKYDNERMECLYPLLVHYCCEGQYKMAYNYYLQVKDFYETKYLSTNLDGKLFVSIDKYNFFVPYYMILIADKMQDYECVIKMFEIVFSKKMQVADDHYVGNILFNLQFFIQRVKPENMERFINLANEYIRFLNDLGIQLQRHEFLREYNNRFGIDVSYIFNNPVNKVMNFSKEECIASKNILIYTGYANVEWNYSYLKTNALGGSEKAVAYLSKELATLLASGEYNVYVAGVVQSESFDNVSYISLQDIPYLIKSIPFNTVICSRYISFLEIYKECAFDKFYIWAHDIILLYYGCNLSDKQIITKWDKYITGCICQTEWHANLFKDLYPELTNKITAINNGLDKNTFLNETVALNNYKKQSNKFIYSSRPERGLDTLLQLWPQILEILPDAELVLATYGSPPDQPIIDIINKYSSSIKYLGKLNTEDLYKEMKTAEYWLYPTKFTETSCITGMEMLMSEVICLYYPVAGLINTMDKYGIQIAPGNEIETLLSLTVKQKYDLKINGKNYAMSCSWENRAKEWAKVIFSEKCGEQEIKTFIRNLHNTVSMPQNHTNYLKKLAIDFEPNVIYDIGSSVLHWTREAHKIWPNAEIVAFDAIKTAEFLYKEHNVKYHIGVLSEQDNNTVKFYENMDHPAGNSYYKEIGHVRSNEMYPENAFTEQLTMTLSTAVKNNHFALPDLIKIDVQGAELDIIKGGLDVINNAKYLIVELQDTEYNRGAPLAATTIKFLEENGWELIAPKFSNNGPDADYCFKNKRNFNEPTSDIKTFIRNLYDVINIPQNHIDYLKKLAIDFEPKIVYDIGSAVLHWTREAHKIWPNSEIIAFDASEDTEFFYKEHNIKYNIGVLSDENDKIVKFYGNIYSLGGNSYYKEIGHAKSNEIFPEDLYTEQKTISLASAVSKNKFALPDLIKMDVQGAELDIIKGGLDVINNAKYLIVELQDTQYNRGAPLATTTIQFLENNDWELIAPKFCDNGPDADYCFKNKRRDINFKWAFLMPLWYVPNILNDYFDNLKTICNIIYTKDVEYLKSFNPKRVSFVYEINDDLLNYCKNNNIEFTFLNTEPLTINDRLQTTMYNCKKCNNIKIYDYSKSNIQILNQNGFTNTKYLSYTILKEENQFLKDINKNLEKVYDYGILSQDNPISCTRRVNVVNFLIENGFTVHIIHNLWKKERDIELAKCKIILNIHGQYINTPANIFEHLRCDRLLEAGYKILSEDSYCLDPNYIEKYKDNLQIIKYEEFLMLKTYATNKIIDCFTFYNEINMLTYRLNVLNDVVDYFILVEANQTFVGKPKPLFYNENKHLFEKFNKKIIHIIVDLPFDNNKINIANGDQWSNEHFQRNCISQGIDKITLLDQDLIIISDVDEIPDPNTLKKLKNDKIDIGFKCLELDFYYYNLNSKINSQWPLTKILSYKKYKELNTTCENIRQYWTEPILRGGWHLSYFGDFNFIKNKLENFSHQELNIDAYTNDEKIKEKINKCIDLFDRDSVKISYINIKDNQYLPPLYDTYLTEF